MTFSLHSSIKSRLFRNSSLLLLGVKELVVSVWNPVSKEITASTPYIIENGVSHVDLRGVVRYFQRMWQLFHPFSLCIIQPLLKSIHYDFIDNLGLSIPLWISCGGIPIRNSQVAAVPSEGFIVKLKSIVRDKCMRSQTEWQCFSKQISWHPCPWYLPIV